MTAPRVPARFEIYQDRGGQWRWRLRARNGRIVADGAEGYASRRNVRRALATTMDAVDEADRLALLEAPP